MQSRNSMPALLALSLGYFALGTASLAPVGLNHSIGAGLHVAPARVGLLVTIFALTFAVTAPFAPAVLRRLDRKHALMLGLALLTLGSVLTALASSYAMLAVVRVVAALGAAIYGPGASAAGAQIVAPERRQRALAVVFAGMTTAAVLGIPLASFLGNGLGWRQALLGVAVLSAISLLAVVVLVPKVPAGEPPTIRAYRTALHTPAAVPTVVTTLLFMGAQFTVYGIAGAYLADRFGAGDSLVTATLLAFGIVGLAGTLTSANIAEAIGATRTVTIALAGLAVGLVLLATVPHIKAGVVVFVAWAFFSQVYQAPQQGRLIGLLPSQPALILALNASALYLGISLGSTIGSTLLSPLGSRLIPLVGLALLALAGLCHLRSEKGSGPAEVADVEVAAPSPSPTPAASS
jgi:DHA1 family inner membrane transport protein